MGVLIAVTRASFVVWVVTLWNLVNTNISEDRASLPTHPPPLHIQGRRFISIRYPIDQRITFRPNVVARQPQRTPSQHLFPVMSEPQIHAYKIDCLCFNT